MWILKFFVMKIVKEYETKFLDVPVGTKMYLVITNRMNTGLFIEEVVYEGYTPHFVQRDYYDPGKMSAPEYWTEPEYEVRFKSPSEKTQISFACCEYSWTGQRGYDTDEHLECGAGIKGLKLSTYGLDGVFDAYFTTNKEKLADYLKKEVAGVKDFLTNADTAYEKELAEVEAKYEKEKAALKDKYKLYGEIFNKLVKLETELGIKNKR